VAEAVRDSTGRREATAGEFMISVLQLSDPLTSRAKWAMRLKWTEEPGVSLQVRFAPGSSWEGRLLPCIRQAKNTDR
jgi:hypothetical protein